MEMRKAAGIALGCAVAITPFAALGYSVWSKSPIEVSKRDVREMLKDPGSAIFSDLEVCEDKSENILYVSGYVNSKNSYGAMAGNSFFVSEILDDIALSSIKQESVENWNLANYLQQVKLEGELNDKRTCGALFKAAKQKRNERIEFERIADEAADAAINEIAAN